MDPERWRRIEEIYYKALELEPGQRNLYLDQCCAADESLRKEVDRLLQDQPEAEAFIESPAVEMAAKALFGGKGGVAVQPPIREPADSVAADLPAAQANQPGP